MDDLNFNDFENTVAKLAHRKTEIIGVRKVILNTFATSTSNSTSFS